MAVDAVADGQCAGGASDEMMGGHGWHGRQAEAVAVPGRQVRRHDLLHHARRTTRASTRSSPSSMTVLIDQDHVQNFLVELENSPMSIQVMDFELARPSARVTKPEKGEHPPAAECDGRDDGRDDGWLHEWHDAA